MGRDDLPKRVCPHAYDTFKSSCLFFTAIVTFYNPSNMSKNFDAANLYYNINLSSLFLYFNVNLTKIGCFVNLC